MVIILDELTTKEFFENGGAVRVTVTNEEVSRLLCEKPTYKHVFLDNDSFSRIFKLVYLKYHMKHPEYTFDKCVYDVNDSVSLSCNIGNKKYQLGVDNEVLSLDMCKFHYIGENEDYGYKKEIKRRDAYGIKNVNFSEILPDDRDWERYKLQRLNNGYDESELWNLDLTIAKFVYPRLKDFFDSYPETYCPSDVGSYKEWMDVGNKMISTFKKIIELGEYKKRNEVTTDNDSDVKYISEGLELFVKYFNYLWT